MDDVPADGPSNMTLWALTKLFQLKIFSHLECLVFKRLHANPNQWPSTTQKLTPAPNLLPIGWDHGAFQGLDRRLPPIPSECLEPWMKSPDTMMIWVSIFHLRLLPYPQNHHPPRVTLRYPMNFRIWKLSRRWDHELVLPVVYCSKRNI